MKSKLVYFLVGLCIFSFLTPSLISAKNIPFDILIRNGKIIDGSGKEAFNADIGIWNGWIAAIGDLSSERGVEEIDARGLVVAPGFIDVHTHADEGVLDQPRAPNFVRDGVTTLVTGNCGGSPSNLNEFFNNLEEKGSAVNIAALIGHNTLLREVKGSTGDPLTEEQLEECKKLAQKAMENGAVG